MDREVWIDACAHRLQRRWKTIDPLELETLAANLWRDERLRAMAPAQAAIDWLRPVAFEDGNARRHRIVD